MGHLLRMNPSWFGVLFVQASLACLSAPPTVPNRFFHRARGVPNLESNDNSRLFQTALESEQLSGSVVSKCPSDALIPYSAGELRTVASLISFDDEPQIAVEFGGRLSCSFDDLRERCSWYNVQTGGVRFWKAEYGDVFDLERFDCTSERSFPYEDHFLLAGGEATLLPQTVAIEAAIPCQYGNATLTFDFWVNKETPVLRLCVITMENVFNCEEMKEWGFDAPISTSIPASEEPFRLRIEISGITYDTIVFIDNINYVGQICEIVNDEPRVVKEEAGGARQAGAAIKSISMTRHEPGDYADEAQVNATSEEPLEEVHDSETVDACEALTCNFNEEHTCMYSLSGIGSTSPWFHSRAFLGNPLTGVHQNSPNDYKTTGFVVVGRNHVDISDEVFVMESAVFTLRRAVRLNFDLFLRSFGPQLKVCIDSFDYCPYSSPTVNKETYWFENPLVYIPPGERKVFFIAGKLRQNQFLAIDNIRVRTEDGKPYCDTNNS